MFVVKSKTFGGMTTKVATMIDLIDLMSCLSILIQLDFPEMVK